MDIRQTSRITSAMNSFHAWKGWQSFWRQAASTIASVLHCTLPGHWDHNCISATRSTVTNWYSNVIEMSVCSAFYNHSGQSRKFVTSLHLSPMSGLRNTTRMNQGRVTSFVLERLRNVTPPSLSSKINSNALTKNDREQPSTSSHSQHLILLYS